VASLLSHKKFLGTASQEPLKDAIASLPQDERHIPAVWHSGLDYDDWDSTMVKDFSRG
jgi:hypothetical protein